MNIIEDAQRLVAHGMNLYLPDGSGITVNLSNFATKLLEAVEIIQDSKGKDCYYCDNNGTSHHPNCRAAAFLKSLEEK